MKITTGTRPESKRRTPWVLINKPRCEIQKEQDYAKRTIRVVQPNNIWALQLNIKKKDLQGRSFRI